MINCPKCWAALPDDVLYCLNCGTQVVDNETQTVVLPKPQPRQPPKTNVAVVIATALGVAVVALLFVIALKPTQVAQVQPQPTPQATTVYVTVLASPTATQSVEPEVKIQTAIPPANMVPQGDVPQQAESTSPPSDATAYCNDGTYTKWLDVNKACSANGGVHTWLIKTNEIRQGARPRAICKDGGISYFSGDVGWVCGFAGIRHLFWQYSPPPPKNRPLNEQVDRMPPANMAPANIRRK